MKESKVNNNLLTGGEGIKLDMTSDILEVCIKFLHYKHVNRSRNLDASGPPIF